MKSCLGILLVFSSFVAVIGGAAFIWYLSNTAEFSRKDLPGMSAPKAAVPIPQTTPKAQPVR